VNHREAFSSLTSKFTSGNKIPVERATILRDEWEALKRIAYCPLLSVDAVCMYRGSIVLIERKNPPLGLALPGGMVDVGERVETAVIRELKEETNLWGNIVSFIGVYSDPKRDFRDHIITLAYVVEAEPSSEPKAMDDAKSIALLEPNDALAQELIADHRKILEDAMARVFRRGIYG